MNPHTVIRGTGSYLPEQVISNQFLAKKLNISESQIIKKTGVHERRWASEKEASSDLATIASLKALKVAGIQGKELDIIVFSSTSPDMTFPSSAVLLQKNVGAGKIPAFDIQASCSGFVYALTIADNHLKQTGARFALVASGEVKSKTLNLGDPGTAILFGDGGGAVVLAKTRKKEGFLSFHLHSDGRKHDFIQLPAGGSRLPSSPETLKKSLHSIQMKGLSVYRSAVLYFEQVIQEVLDEQGIKLSEIDLFVFHQANFRLLEKVMKNLKIPKEKVELTIQQYGNTSSASIPITLDQAVSKKKIKKGDLLLLASFGGGVTWASTLYRW
ncbi:MAG: ketoacyl-ACP synthase III [Nitrospirae bacterium]|nr:ketoacyl-ACP synthase III [Nitrospirota bacterium]MBI3351869.1 ketoacyl-ACP synthase III [Nitrospirota bacterium]